MTPEQPTIRIERTIEAPPERVYRAWLEPDLLRQWLAPGSLEVTRAEVDETVGGRFRIWQASGGEQAGGFECELLELVPNERLVFRWGFVGPDRDQGPRFDSLLTVTFSPAPGGTTKLVLVHERLDALRTAMPDVADNVEPGWASALQKLATTVEETE
jgi:uncharacterized protein YndB with AHSA1/START domain